MDDRERLNQLGRQWTKWKSQSTQDELKNLELDIFLLIFKLFPRYSDQISTMYLKDWEKFDAEKGSLYPFCVSRLNRRKQDNEKDDMDGRTWKQEDLVTGESKKVKVRHASLNVPVGKTGETGEREWEDMVSTPERDMPDAMLMANDRMIQLLTLMLRLPQELRGRANNSQRLNYFRMFFTDSVADIAQNLEGVSALEERERDLFQVLQLAFLDFFQTQTCRTVTQLRSSRNKPYGQMVPGRPMKDPGHPLPNDVYCAYFEQHEGSKVGASALSNQRSAYKELLEGRCC